MHITPDTMTPLAQRLRAERRQQGLTREQAAAVCNVSPSFIRDAESRPETCSLLKLAQLTRGLGLTLTLDGFSAAPTLPDTQP
jgi:transcriptional regulator with XRE-family HTH domain